jgi:hypothetical protein
MAAKYYLLKEYVNKGYDFNSIFPDKVQEVQKLTNMLFTLQDIVNYLQKQTNDFKIENPVAKDLDSAIYKLIVKSEGEYEAPEPEPKDDKQEIEELAIISDGFYDELSGDTSGYTDEQIEELKLLLDGLVEELDFRGYNKEEIKKYKSVL